MNNLVSIITPAYNAENYIEETIDSVISQTYKNWEMIIVNDNSIDNTGNIIDSYAKKYNQIKVIHLLENKGVAFARNTAISHSKVRYIAFLDADDVWVENKLEIQVNFMIERDAVLSYSHYSTFSGNTNDRKKIVKAPYIMKKSDILKNTSIGCLTVMIDKSKVNEIHVPDVSHSEDQCTWISVLDDKYIAYGIDEILAFYRVSINSLSGNKLKSAKKQWDVYRNYHKLSWSKSIYYFCCYVINVIKR